MLTSKTTQNNHTSFLLTRYDEAQSFTCARCKQVKKANIVVHWTDSSRQQKAICNGCYGFVLYEGA